MRAGLSLFQKCLRARRAGALSEPEMREAACRTGAANQGEPKRQVQGQALRAWNVVRLCGRTRVRRASARKEIVAQELCLVLPEVRATFGAQERLLHTSSEIAFTAAVPEARELRDVIPDLYMEREGRLLLAAARREHPGLSARAWPGRSSRMGPP